jgi:UDP-GlcNAc:undecaprenyl-phosphate GlcNAc-1-phosphate transferase
VRTHVTLLLYCLAPLLGFLFAYAVIPWIIRFATKNDVLDFPSDARRIHREAVPRLGGVAVYFALVFAATIGWLVRSFLGLPTDASLLPLGEALTIIFALGLVDDLRGVSPRTKLLVQTMATLVLLVGQGVVPQSFLFATGFPAVPLGMLAMPLMVLWVVGVTNAFNLIDGMDGLAGTAALIGIVVCVWLDAFSSTGQSPELMLAAAGAVLAFLVFNRTPARIFLGDSGSMMLGFLLAVRLVTSSTTAHGQSYLLVPLFTLALPLMDTAIAIARRWLRGDPFSQADGRHIHHQILALGISPRTTVELLGFFFGAIAVLGVSIAFAPPRFTFALMVAAGVTLFATTWYGLRWLRYHEFAVLGGSLASVVRNARLTIKEKIRTDEVAQRLAKAQTIEEVNDLVAQLVGETRLLDIEVFESPVDVHGHGPSRQRISAYDALPVRLDYPFNPNQGGGRGEMVLRIWCPRPSMTTPNHSAERVASRLGPALESWYRARHRLSANVTPEEAAQLTAERSVPTRLSGERPVR